MKLLNTNINDTGALLKQLATTANNSTERERLKQIAQTYSALLDRIERLDKQLIAESSQRLKVIHENENEIGAAVVGVEAEEEEKSLIQAQ